MTKLDAHIAQLTSQVDTQERTIKRLWVEKARMQKTIDYLGRELERATNRKPTEEEIREAIFGGE